eukprot:2524279-Pleurochrysis_carterae.AAC.1
MKSHAPGRNASTASSAVAKIVVCHVGLTNLRSARFKSAVFAVWSSTRSTRAPSRKMPSNGRPADFGGSFAFGAWLGVADVPISMFLSAFT